MQPKCCTPQRKQKPCNPLAIPHHRMSLHSRDTGKTKNFLGMAGTLLKKHGAPRMETQMPFPLSPTALLKLSQEQLGKKNKTKQKTSKLEIIQTFSVHRHGPIYRKLKQSARETRKTIKYSKIYLAKGMQDLCIEKYKTLPRINEKDLGKGKLLLLLIANKMSILINNMAILLWLMRSIQSPPKSKQLLSLELASRILQSLRNCKGLQIVLQRNTFGVLSPQNCKHYYGPSINTDV